MYGESEREDVNRDFVFCTLDYSQQLMHICICRESGERETAKQKKTARERQRGREGGRERPHQIDSTFVEMLNLRLKAPSNYN